MKAKDREGSRNLFIYPEQMNDKERLKRVAVSVLSDYMTFDITDDEMDYIEREIGYAARQFMREAKQYEKISAGLNIDFYGIVTLYYFYRCIRIVDDFLCQDPETIKPVFFKQIEKTLNNL